VAALGQHKLRGSALSILHGCRAQVDDEERVSQSAAPSRFDRSIRAVQDQCVTAPGWYRDPHGQAPLRWWNGYEWTLEVSASAPPPGAADLRSQSRALAVIAVWALLVIGTVMALFTSVSLLSGTTMVWFGVALTVVGAIVSFVIRQVGIATKVIAVLLVAACIANGVYDEVQLQHKRDQLNNLFNN
jgi:hypothetical protein